MPTQTWQCDALSLAEELRDGRVSPVEMRDQFLAGIQKPNPPLNAVVCLNDKAFADAGARPERLAADKPGNRIDGSPIPIKDNPIARDMPAPWREMGIVDHD